jgi:hypothetical protein
VEHEHGEFIPPERMTSVRHWRTGIASDGEGVAVLVSIELGEDVQLEEGGEFSFSMDLDSAKRLSASLWRCWAELEALIAAQTN